MGIKKFTGYVTSDGKTFNTQKEATDHETACVVEAQVNAAFGSVAPASHGESVQRDDGDNFVVFADDIPQFLFDNRAAILVALVPAKAKRAPYKPRQKKAKPAVAAAPAPAPAPAPAAARPDAVAAATAALQRDEGISFIDDDSDVFA